MSSNDTNSQAWTAFQLALKHVNANSSLLPNTSLKSFEDQLFINQDNLYESASNISKANTAVIIADSQTMFTHET